MTAASPGQTLTITPAVDSAALAAMALSANTELVAFGAGLVIEDSETAEVIAEALTAELGKIDRIEEMRKGATSQLNALKRTIDGWFKPGREVSEALVRLYKDALGAWHQKLVAAREAALVSAAQAMHAGDVAGLTQALTVANAPDAKPTGVGFVDGWAFRVVNLKMLIDYASHSGRLDLVEPSDKRLRELSRGSAEPAPVPGVLFEKSTQVRGSHG